MTANRISATLAAADRDAVLAAITTIRQKLPFLIDLTAEERSALSKFGDKSRAFVSKALEIASQNPSILPRSFDLDEMRSDFQLFQDLQPILMALNQAAGPRTRHVDGGRRRSLCGGAGRLLLCQI